MKTLAAIQPSFIPWRGYFDIINKSDIFVFYDHVQYDKNGLRNRNRILVKNQIKWLTLPVKKAKLGTKIKDIKIHNPKFELNKIKRIIYEAYNNHPNFNFFYDFLNKIFDEKNWISLSELNIEIIKRICDLLLIKPSFRLSSELNNIKDKNLNLIKLCKFFNCDTYLSGEGGKNYTNEDLFRQNDINLTWHNWKEKQYKQFNNNRYFEKLSIIDYIFNNETNK